MSAPNDEHKIISRRAFLQAIRWAPVLFLPPRMHGIPFAFPSFEGDSAGKAPNPTLHLTPHYPTKTPLEDLFRQILPGSDEYITEKYAFEIKRLLNRWAQELKATPHGVAALADMVPPTLKVSSLVPIQEVPVRSRWGIEVVRRKFSGAIPSSQERFLQDMRTYLHFSTIETAEFEILGIEELSPTGVQAKIRYELVGTLRPAGKEQRIGNWLIQWSRGEPGNWRILKWESSEETVSRATKPLFADVSSQVLGQIESYQAQMLHGSDYWRTILDGACGIDVYGNNGIAVGDFDNDGRDDIYICQPAGLPNRLYRNRGDGIFEDVTEKSGVGVLDNSSCALFADFDNRGFQDLLVVCGSGPLLFLNQGNGRYSLKRDAFKFERTPQGTFTHAAIADYNRDGRLDIYLCLYNYYVGLDQYHYPVPYYDARNGPPNFLLENEGNGRFVDRTEAAGLNAENDRFSFACAWGDCDGNLWPDLYVANDFGRSSLYRNNGDGTFRAVSEQARVQDPGAGMSACWADFDNDGRQDIYVANMWSAAGMRVSEQKAFQQSALEDIRALYRRHARGNSLYRNKGDGNFENVSEQTKAEIGRWAWSSDAWDFDHDGHSDLYVTNGYITGSDTRDLSSFFWRDVVGKSPQNATPSPSYEQGWNAINELIRSDLSWNGPERNIFYLNNEDGTFSDISGIAGLDFPDDSRSFSLADLDGDGRLELILKNRSAPQVRILRNNLGDIGSSICFRLRGTKSNRDAIGAAVTVHSPKPQTKYVQAGSGFLSQHTKELHFGLGNALAEVRASVRWPSGLIQTFQELPVNNRIDIEEGAKDFIARAFAPSRWPYTQATTPRETETLPETAETWLLEPLSAPDFSLSDLGGKTYALGAYRGKYVIVCFWTTQSPASAEQLRLLSRRRAQLTPGNLQVLTINADDSGAREAVQKLIAQEAVPFPVLLATAEVAGVYNITYRYLFDRRRDLPLPASFLIDPEGMIVKIYQGTVQPDRLIDDVRIAPRKTDERVARALPFPGTLHLDTFQRNAFTYGVALFQRGYLDQAVESFRKVIAARPQEPEAYYNLGTLYLRKNDLQQARRYLKQAAELRPTYAEAWNNLGMIAAESGQTDEAVRDFQQSLALRPAYATALLNLGNLYRRQGSFSEAERLLRRALEAEPENPEVNYNLGMLYARQNDLAKAADFFQRAVGLRPDYPDALNNLGVLFVRQGRYAEAQEKFETCIRVAPNLDQGYLNLARLYVVMKNNDKARDVLQTLLRQQPENKMAQQTLEMLH